MPRLDLAPRDLQGAGGRPGARWPGGSWRSSSERGQDAQSRRPTPAGFCSARSPPSANASRTPPAIGERIVTLGSLTLTPLRARRGQRASTRTRPRSRSPAPPTSSTGPPGRRVPARPPADDARSRSTTSARRPRRPATLAPRGGTVCVLGAGHAGKLALAAARDATGGGNRRRRRRRPGGSTRPWSSGLCDIGVSRRPARPARGARRRCGRRGAARRPHRRRRQRHRLRADRDPPDRRWGTVLFFSMATSFSARRAGRRRRSPRRRG